jgi:hypothetical protein
LSEAVLLAAALTSPVLATGSPAPVALCAAAKLAAAGKKAQSLLACNAKAATKGIPVDTGCVTKAQNTFTAAFQKAEALGGCTSTGDAGAVEGDTDTFVTNVVGQLRPSQTASKCVAMKLAAVGGKVAGMLGAFAKDEKKPDAGKLLKSVVKVQGGFVKTFAAAEKKGDCETTGDAQTLEATADGFVGLATSLLRAPADISFSNVAVTPGLPAPVTLNGQLTVVPTNADLEGQVVATYGSGGKATLTFKLGFNVSIGVGADTLTVAMDQLSFTFDGMPLAPADAIGGLSTDVASGKDPSQWATQSQALLALSAIIAVPSFGVDLTALEQSPSAGALTTRAATVNASTAVNANIQICSLDGLAYALAGDWTPAVCIGYCAIVTAMFAPAGGAVVGPICLLGCIPGGHPPDPLALKNLCCRNIPGGCPCSGGTIVDDNGCGGEEDPCQYTLCFFPSSSDCGPSSACPYCEDAPSCPDCTQPGSPQCTFGPVPGCVPIETSGCCCIVGDPSYPHCFPGDLGPQGSHGCAYDTTDQMCLGAFGAKFSYEFLPEPPGTICSNIPAP